MADATIRQGEVLDAIVAFTGSNGYPPTRQELADQLGVRSTTVQYHLEALKAKGLVDYQPNAARTLRVNTERLSQTVPAAPLTKCPDGQRRQS